MLGPTHPKIMPSASKADLYRVILQQPPDQRDAWTEPTLEPGIIAMQPPQAPGRVHTNEQDDFMTLAENKYLTFNEVLVRPCKSHVASPRILTTPALRYGF
jgi:hypothetical protein